jgi:hypothetical protein
MCFDSIKQMLKWPIRVCFPVTLSSLSDNAVRASKATLSSVAFHAFGHAERIHQLCGQCCCDGMLSILCIGV